MFLFPSSAMCMFAVILIPFVLLYFAIGVLFKIYRKIYEHRHPEVRNDVLWRLKDDWFF